MPILSEKGIESLVKFCIGCSILVLLILSYTFYLKGHISFSSDIDPNHLSAFGTFIGGVIGTILGLTTTLLVWATYKSQSLELKQTREISKEQSDSLRRQQFESYFFNLLSCLEQSVEVLNYTDEALTLSNGRETFTEFLSDFQICYKEYKAKYPKGDEFSQIRFSYNEFMDNYPDLQRYSQILKQLIFAIDEAEISNKDRYSRLIQAQLSRDEHILFFYTAIVELSGDIKRIIEDYSLLKWLRPEFLLDKSHYDLFSQAAYGEGNI